MIYRNIIMTEKEHKLSLTDILFEKIKKIKLSLKLIIEN
jgi:hypothetical protein